LFTIALLLLVSGHSARAQQKNPYENTTRPLIERGLKDLSAYALLSELSEGIGPRLSGSEGAAKAVVWAKAKMEALGFQNVRLLPCKVPHWVRGEGENGGYIVDGREQSLSLCALGGSVPTPSEGITADVIEVHSLAEAEKLGERGKGKIVFFNRPMDPTKVNTGEAYGGAVEQRFGGASAAAKSGAVAVLVRSMTLAIDDAPHTGSMGYADRVPKIPAAAISTLAAEHLSALLKAGQTVKVRLKLTCQSLPDADSASVIGEIVGSEKPNEVIVMGGHLDSWDLGRGANDDGTGCVHAMEALSLIQRLGWKPKRTLRVVLFMNEENGGRGAMSYAEEAKKSSQKHIAAIESDDGGFAPMGFGVTATPDQWRRIRRWAKALTPINADRLTEGGGGADIGPLAPLGAALFGLAPTDQRYFDYHHSRHDTIDKVNPRELELGAIALAILSWRLSEEGLPGKSETMQKQ
jgi:hypothetical protein